MVGKFTPNAWLQWLLWGGTGEVGKGVLFYTPSSCVVCMHSCNWLNLKDKEPPWKDVNTGPFWVEELWVIGCISSGLSGFFYDEYRLSVQFKKEWYWLNTLRKHFRRKSYFKVKDTVFYTPDRIWSGHSLSVSPHTHTHTHTHTPQQDRTEAVSASRGQRMLRMVFSDVAGRVSWELW